MFLLLILDLCACAKQPKFIWLCWWLYALQ
jgi:hypothetical protein